MSGGITARMRMIPLVLTAILTIGAAPPHDDAAPAAEPAKATPSYHLAACYPHDEKAFTQGLFWLDGHLYESTGQVGHSTIRKVRLEDGAVLRSVDIPPGLFGEGIVNWDGDILNITWRAGKGWRWNRDSFEQGAELSYPGEGWGLTQDGASIVMSNGSPDIVFRDPLSFAEERRVTATFRGKPVPMLNELEWVDGAILANVWQTDYIVRIDPMTGEIGQVFDLSAISVAVPRREFNAVLNGIAVDKETGRLFVTGKLWPLLFELRPGPAPEGAGAPCAALPGLRWEQ